MEYTTKQVGRDTDLGKRSALVGESDTGWQADGFLAWNGEEVGEDTKSEAQKDSEKWENIGTSADGQGPDLVHHAKVREWDEILLYSREKSFNWVWHYYLSSLFVLALV